VDIYPLEEKAGKSKAYLGRSSGRGEACEYRGWGYRAAYRCRRIYNRRQVKVNRAVKSGPGDYLARSSICAAVYYVKLYQFGVLGGDLGYFSITYQHYSSYRGN
jgi:hypothetical protein